MSRDIAAIAGRILAAHAAGTPIAPITDGDAGFDIEAAYRVSEAIAGRRIARGERPVGWKIGFTNRTIWDEYGVHAPIWGPVYDTTASEVPTDGPFDVPLAGLMEPRLEAEIVFRVATPPTPEMNDAELFACVDGITHGFEIVQSVFPAWRFKAADTIAAFALHGRLFHGPFTDLSAADAGTWIAGLKTFEISLDRDGVPVDRGLGANVLDSPLSALGHFVRGLDRIGGERLKAGDIVTTGTVTRAHPIAAGETWRSGVFGLPLKGLTVSFS